MLPNNIRRSAIQAVVLGASKGIGLEVFTYLAQAGFKVIGTYRTCSNLLEHRIAQFPSNNHLRITFYDTSNADCEIYEKASIIVDCTTPRIFVGDTVSLSPPLLNSFNEAYSSHLIKIVHHLDPKENHLIITPSSSAVEELPLGLIEYAAAKRSLEMFAYAINLSHPNLKCLTPRLPRVSTNQTLSVLKIQKSLTPKQAASMITRSIYSNIDHLSAVA